MCHGLVALEFPNECLDANWSCDFQGLLSVCSKSAKMSLQCHRAEVYDGSKEA